MTPGNPGSRRWRRPAWVVWAAIGLVAVGVIWAGFPSPAAISGVWPTDLFLSFRALLGLTLAAAALVTVPLALRQHRRALLALGLVFAVGAAGQVPVLAWRATRDQTVPASAGTLAVLSFNTYSSPDVAAIAALTRTTGARIVAMPETSQATALAVAARLREAGRDFEVFGADLSSAPGYASALMIDRRLGRYEMSGTGETARPSFIVRRAGEGSGPAAIGVVHTVNPMFPHNTGAWRAETSWATRQCGLVPGTILAGDFNATIDHPGFGQLGGCLDAASAAGRTVTGTWPAFLPAALATPIDHVLADAGAWQVTSFEVLPPAGGSDHRPVLARLTPRL